MGSTEKQIYTDADGKIVGCGSCSHICHYRCCDQSRSGKTDFEPENSILLYPGEWEAASSDMKGHLDVTMEDFNGGKLAYCDPGRFDQSSCNSKRNFKPLDCQTYPFFPTLSSGRLELLVDAKRCPLPSSLLSQHHADVLKRWKEVLEARPTVADWITRFRPRGYVPCDWPTTSVGT